MREGGLLEDTCLLFSHHWYVVMCGSERSNGARAHVLVRERCSACCSHPNCGSSPEELYNISDISESPKNIKQTLKKLKAKVLYALKHNLSEALIEHDSECASDETILGASPSVVVVDKLRPVGNGCAENFNP